MEIDDYTVKLPRPEDVREYIEARIKSVKYSEFEGITTECEILLDNGHVSTGISYHIHGVHAVHKDLAFHNAMLPLIGIFDFLRAERAYTTDQVGGDIHGE